MEHQKKILITSALPYVNNIPHLGNIIGCVLSADVFARYQRLHTDREVLYVCGTDEYGTATEMKALEEKKTCKEICDHYYLLHKEIYEWMNISFDIFGRTSTQEQTTITQDIFTKLWDKNYISEGVIEQLFCEGCNIFLADRYIYGECYLCHSLKAKGDQCDECQKLLDSLLIINPKCKVCSSTPIVKKSEHLFLDLDKLQPVLESFLKTTESTSNTEAVTASWLKAGLQSRCITRDLKWGTPVPHIPGLEKYKDKVFYVWFDAPIGYISIVAHDRLGWETWFKNPSNVSLYQFMAKDNIPFHSILFPASLLGTGEPYTLFKHINAVEYLMYNGEKFSKGNNVGIFGDHLLKSKIPADIWRIYLLWIRPEKMDSNFSTDHFKLFNNSELLANVGNYVNRIVGLIKKLPLDIKFQLNSVNYSNAVESNLLNYSNTVETIQSINTLLTQYHTQMQQIQLSSALRTIFEISAVANKFLTVSEPWKKGDVEYKTINLFLNLNMIRMLASILEPFIPETSAKINNYLGTKSVIYTEFKSEFTSFPDKTLGVLFTKME
jgi:methionyl-tRNA synthetase